MTSPQLDRRVPGRAALLKRAAAQPPEYPTSLTHIDVVPDCDVTDESLTRIAERLRAL